MKDRFRFRVWNNRDWDNEFGQVYYDAEEAYDYLRGNPQITASSFGELLEDDQWIVEQCTGLKDKNGKLIYEGDIIYPNYEIKWSSLGYVLPNGNNLSFYNGSCEVIGNIHENPELLKESK